MCLKIFGLDLNCYGKLGNEAFCSFEFFGGYSQNRLKNKFIKIYDKKIIKNHNMFTYKKSWEIKKKRVFQLSDLVVQKK